ncbi:MAG TPA: hydrogenase expression/formation protein HypE [Anaerolineales bacterium]|nr:hydrogenase expression/formation protein HypE [Anaerolineales bacterium]
MNSRFDFTGWTCPMPLQHYPTIVMGHGSGGKMMADLIQYMFASAFQNDILNQLGDSAVISMDGNRLAFTTDSFVVSPLFFPGGDIGELAINGTVNDLAMSGARPMYLSAGFILEEGLAMETLGRVVESVARACREANVQLITGDTKVVNKGHGDGLYINTTGIGLVRPGVNISPKNAQPGDAVIVSGTMGDHGIAILSVREGLQFETEICSDSAPLNSLVDAMLDVTRDIHCLRDATRGGLSAVLNELASASKMGIEFEEKKVPVGPEVNAACEMLGLDPFYIANEGKLVAIIPAQQADAVLEAMHSHPFGKDAVRIGYVVASHPGLVVAKTSIGGSRVVDLPAGELLPRIC